MTTPSFEQMTDAQIQASVGLTAGERGFEAATQARVFANELMRARGRFAHHRTLYAAFVEAGTPYMVENLDDVGDGRAVPAKLIFADEAPGPEVSANPMLTVWTERALLAALSEERAVQDFFAGLLDELAPQLGR